jgi:hypothetical protein
MTTCKTQHAHARGHRLLVTGIFLFMASTVLDFYLFLRPDAPLSSSATWLRPMTAYAIRRCCYALCSKGLSLSSDCNFKCVAPEPARPEKSKLGFNRTVLWCRRRFGVVTIHTLLNSVTVRLTTSSETWTKLFVVVAVDWLFFIMRTCTVGRASPCRPFCAVCRCRGPSRKTTIRLSVAVHQIDEAEGSQDW